MSQDTSSAQPGTPDDADHSLHIHTCARDLLAWLLPALGRFPREQRHTVQQHMADLAMRVLDQLIAARHLPGGVRAQALREADMALDQLRQYAHIALLHKWWSPGQYEHFSRLSTEVGRLLDGWRRRLATLQGEGAENNRAGALRAPRSGPHPCRCCGKDERARTGGIQ